MKVRIGHLSTFYHTALLLMAQGRDADRRIGAAIEWRLFGTGPSIVEAFAQGELDLAYLGLPPAIIGISRGVEIVCVAGGHMEGTVLAGGPECRTIGEVPGVEDVLRQFQGRVIGVPGRGSIHDVILREYLDRHGLANDVAVKNYAWADLITDAMASGEVAAAVGTPALAASVRRFAQGKVLCPAALLWPDNPSYGIVASLQFLRSGREAVERILVLHEEATALLRELPEEASQIIADQVEIVDPGLVLDALRISPKYCAALTDAYMRSTMRFLEPLQRLGYLEHEVSREQVFDTSLISIVHPMRDHYGDGLALD